MKAVTFAFGQYVDNFAGMRQFTQGGGSKPRVNPVYFREQGVFRSVRLKLQPMGETKTNAQRIAPRSLATNGCRTISAFERVFNIESTRHLSKFRLPGLPSPGASLHDRASFIVGTIHSNASMVFARCSGRALSPWARCDSVDQPFNSNLRSHAIGCVVTVRGDYSHLFQELLHR